MEIFSSIEEALAKYPGAILSFERIGNCMVCGGLHDLRCGSCFECCSKVDGEPVKGGHRLWQKDKPENTWYVGA